jgi:hypothetical protein
MVLVSRMINERAPYPIRRRSDGEYGALKPVKRPEKGSEPIFDLKRVIQKSITKMLPAAVRPPTSQDSAQHTNAVVDAL